MEVGNREIRNDREKERVKGNRAKEVKKERKKKNGRRKYRKKRANACLPPFPYRGRAP